MMVAVDFTITIGNIIEIGAIAIGGLTVLWTLRYDVRALKDGANALKADINAMQAEIKQFGDILVDLAEVRGEIKTLDTRLTGAEQDIREMRHGDGFIRSRSKA